VTIVHQLDHFQAEPVSAQEALASPKIEVVWDSEPRAFLGEKQLEALRIENVKTKEVRELRTDGVFVFVGYVPRTDLVKGLVRMNEWGYVETGEDMSTEVPGLYVAGDIRAKKFRQITTAVADGTIAALAAQKFLKDRK
jgi:thioredoxin reductase (NADPH)